MFYFNCTLALSYIGCIAVGYFHTVSERMFVIRIYGCSAFFVTYFYVLASVWKDMRGVSLHRRVANALVVLVIMAAVCYGTAWVPAYLEYKRGELLTVGLLEIADAFGWWFGACSIFTLPYTFVIWRKRRGKTHRPNIL